MTGLNKAELTALSQPLSNDARVLYMLGLRPSANQKSGETNSIQYKLLRDLLNSKEQKYTLGRQLNSLFKELYNAGLIAVDQDTELDKSLNGKSLILPLVILKPEQDAACHLQWQAMDRDWRPTETLFVDLAQLTGLLNKHYDQNDLGDFIAYWLSRPEVHFSQYQWTQKFVSHLKHKRRSFDKTQLKTVGHQLVPNKVELAVSKNVKELVSKYSEKSTTKN